MARFMDHLLITFRVVDHQRTRGEIPDTYIDLKISGAAEYIWYCRFISDRLGLFKQAKGKTELDAIDNLIKEHGDSIRLCINNYLNNLQAHSVASINKQGLRQ